MVESGHTSPHGSCWLPLFQIQNDIRIVLVIIADILYAVDMIAIYHPHIRAYIHAAPPAHKRPTLDTRVELLGHHPLIGHHCPKNDRHIAQPWHICPGATIGKARPTRNAGELLEMRNNMAARCMALNKFSATG